MDGSCLFLRSPWSAPQKFTEPCFRFRSVLLAKTVRNGFNMAAIHHLGNVVHVFGPSVKIIWSSLSLCKCSFFDYIRVLLGLCSEFVFKMPIYDPRLNFRKRFDPLNWEQNIVTHRKHPCAKTQHIRYCIIYCQSRH